MHASELWSSRSLSARIGRLALTPLSWLYGAGWQCYLALYKFGIKKAQAPHWPIVVVGNLTVGGSGKSPAVVAIANLLRSLDCEVVLGCSGYGSPRSEAATIAPDGPLDAREWGDEPAMFRDLLPETSIVVGRRRVLAAQLVHERYPNAVLLMDDGFQHLPLAHDIAIVLEAGNPINAACLPAGPYREPRKNINRADTVLWTDSTPGFQLIRGETQVDTDARQVTALCAIGQPEQFLTALRRQFEVVAPLVLPDHDTLLAAKLFDDLPDLPIVVTHKDWVKLQNRNDLEGRTILVARQEVKISVEPLFQMWLKTQLLRVEISHEEFADDRSL